MTSPKGILWILSMFVMSFIKTIIPITTTTVAEPVTVVTELIAPVPTTVTVPETTIPKITTTLTTTGTKAVATNDVWWSLAKCECEGNLSCNTGNGYYGTFQFALETWRSVGGSGLPSEASYETQKQYAQILQARSGWGQWPSCAKQLGLL